MPDGLSAIADLLHKRIGLAVRSIGMYHLEKAISKRCSVAQLPDVLSYYHYVSHSPTEFQNLIEEVVIPETWFFRHAESFHCLIQHLKTCGTAYCARPLRLLSLPCSTGEEPYSLAIALLEAGLTSLQFEIDGMDISGKALALAKAGFYGDRAFRRHPTLKHHKFFTERSQGYQVAKLIRDRVQWRQENLLSPHFPHLAPYDYIFCRHLLIYLDSQARARAITRLAQLLAPQGLIFVGSAETGLLRASELQPYPFASAFAFRPASPPLPQGRDRPVCAASNRYPPTPPSVLDDSLELAQNLADRGHLLEAHRQCLTYLQRHPTQAEAHCLLGTIVQAQGKDRQAMTHFQKALYLQPHHYAALTHLILLKENQGELDQAFVLKQRLERLSPLNAYSP